MLRADLRRPCGAGAAGELRVSRLGRVATSVAGTVWPEGISRDGAV